MSFTPVSWLLEQFSRARVGGRQLRSRVPTDTVPGPVLKAAFWVIILVLFLDEFLILAAMFGGPIALAILVGFGLTVYVARKTGRGTQAKRAVSKRVSGSIKSGRRAGYRTRRKTRK